MQDVKRRRRVTKTAAEAPPTDVTDLTGDELEFVVNDAIAELSYVKAQMDVLGARHAELEDIALRGLAKMGQKKSTFDLDDGSRMSGTYVQGTRVVTDEARLKKRLGAVLWGKVTSVVLDVKKLEAAIAMGDVNATTVADCSDVFSNKPYLRVTKRDGA